MKNRYTFAILALGAIIIAEVLARTVLGLGDSPLSGTHLTIEYLYRPNQDVMRFGKRFIMNKYGVVRSDSPHEARSARV